MTAGALLQLKYGLADRMAFLTFNPSISHFKSVYKRYTNFALETIALVPIRNSTLSFTDDTKISFKITRDADLVKDMFLTFQFPDIYSPNSLDVASYPQFNGYYNFQWIKRLAEYLVKEVSITIDSQTDIDRHYSEWFHISSEMTLPAEKKAGYYEMIGNIPEYYDPANGAGCNGTYPSGFDKGNPYVPSIVGRRIVLPLRFWFNNNATTSFPLIATQRMEFVVNVTLRSLQQLYTLVEPGTGNVVRPPSTPVFGTFLQPQTTSNSLDLTVNLEANYIFLEREERKRFALASHEYLITQIQKIGPYSVNGSANTINLDLKNINKPVTNLYFVLRRDDLENVNDWSNFTNWPGQIPPFRTGFHNPYGLNPSPFPAKLAYYKTPYILRSGRILIDGAELADGYVYNFDNGGTEINGKDAFYYNYIQPYMFQKNIPGQGIYSFSFSLDNNEYQPCGAINMSSIQTKQLILNTIDRDTTGGYVDNIPYSFNVYVFALNYEIVKIMGGMFGPATSN